MSDRVKLVATASPIEGLLYLSGWYSTNWERKGCPGSEIQMYYGCPWPDIKLKLENVTLHQQPSVFDANLQSKYLCLAKLYLSRN